MPWLVCILLALIIGCFRIGPPILEPSSYLIGGWGHPDNIGNHWLLVWVADNLLSGQSIVHNNQYYLPFGDYPWLAGNGSEGFLFVPWYVLFGWPAGVVPLVLMYFVGIGLGGYCLGLVCGANKWSALIPSVLLVSTPYWTRELNAGRWSQLDGMWLIASIASFLWLWEKPVSIRRALLCGCLVGLTGIFYWYYAFFFVLMASILVLVSAISRQATPFRSILIAAVTSLLVVSPVLLLFVSNWSLIPGVDEVVFPAPDAMSDALTLGGAWFQTFGRTAGFVLPLPIVLFLFISVARWRKYDAIQQWQLLSALLAMLLFVLLAFGPKTAVFEIVYGWTTPLRRFWWPSRHLLVYNVAAAMIVSIGLSRFRTTSYWSVVLACVSPISLWLQGDQPFHAMHTPLSWPIAEYEEIRTMEGKAILSPPLSPKVANTQLPLLFQMVHRKKILTGHALWVDRVRPSEWDQMMQDNSVLALLQGYEEGTIVGEQTIQTQDMLNLQSMGIDLVVLDGLNIPRTQMDLVPSLAKIYTELWGDPIWRGDGIQVWKTQNWTGVTDVYVPKRTAPTNSTIGNGRHRMPDPVLGRFE